VIKYLVTARKTFLPEEAISLIDELTFAATDECETVTTGLARAAAEKQTHSLRHLIRYTVSVNLMFHRP
jgi:hypothetical protein